MVLAFVFNLLALQDRSATVGVAMTTSALAAGHVISAADVRVVALPADHEALASLLTEAELPTFNGWILSRSLPSGTMLDKASLLDPQAASGFRSMSLPVPVEHAAGGLITVGDKVDVISVADGSARFVAAGLTVIEVADTTSGALSGVGAYYIVVATDESGALALAEALDAGSIEVVRATGATPVGAGVGEG